MSKIAVIGSGIVGVCIAHFLKKNGHQVVLFYQYEPGTQTSFGNAGIFANHDCVFANSPHIWKELPNILFNKSNKINKKPQLMPNKIKETPKILLSNKKDAAELQKQ